MRPAPDLVRVLEAVYAVEAPEAVWLRRVVDALRPALEDGLGMAAYVYDARARPFVVREPILDCALSAEGLGQLLASSDEDYVQGAWLAHAAATASETPGFADHPGVRDVFHPLGIHDVLVVNALDPAGVGCLVGAPLPALRTLAEGEKALWDRVAAHLRAALRLRLRLAALEPAARRAGARRPGYGAAADGADGRVEAVLDRRGRVHHLEAPAESARDALRDAVVAMDRVRREGRARGKGGAGRKGSVRTLASWRALVRGRWTVVDDFEDATERFVVARANRPVSPPATALSTREREVLAALALGRTDKVVAYELGLSHSTVRVLVARAKAKLGATSRADLLARFRALTAPGG